MLAVDGGGSGNAARGHDRAADERRFSSGRARRFARSGSIAILLAVLGAVIAWIIGRQLARPLVELTGAAEALARGDYSERVTSRGTDEIGRLGVAFNRMAEQVQESSNSSAEAVRQLTKSVSTQLFLAEASRILAGSLSDQTLLAELARYCVPKIGDYCSIHVADDDGIAASRRDGALRRREAGHGSRAGEPIPVSPRRSGRSSERHSLAESVGHSAPRPNVGPQHRRPTRRRRACSTRSGRRRSCACRSSRAAARSARCRSR